MKLKNALKAGVAALAFAGAALLPLAAQAQFFFRPFGGVFAETWGDDNADEAPRYGSRRAVASILAREGFRLVGPLGRRGDQVVATGVNSEDGEMRFFIDPFEGSVIRATHVGPSRERLRPQQETRREDYRGEYVEMNGSRGGVREIDPDNERPRRAERPRRERNVARLRETPERQEIQRERLEPPAPKPEAAKPADKPLDKPAETQPAKPARIVYPAPGQSTPTPSAAAPATSAPATPKTTPNNATVVSRPAPAAATPTQSTMPRTAQASGGSTHRAIVPPTTPAASSPITGAR